MTTHTRTHGVTCWDDRNLMEARYDVFSRGQHRQRRSGLSVLELQINTALQTIRRYETYLADPALSAMDRVLYLSKLGAWRMHLQKLRADQAARQAAE